MIGSVVYLDSSAFVKTLLVETESPALVRYLRSADPLASSALLAAEAMRAVLRREPARRGAVEQRLATVRLVAISRDILHAAGTLRPAGLRTLDAIHLATALALGADLDCIVTYDERMAEGARALGFRVLAPR
jgi:predicted nucleic acid-binding protein